MHFQLTASSLLCQKQNRNKVDVDSNASMMDQMMAAASLAKKRKNEKRDAELSQGFGEGMKGGLKAAFSSSKSDSKVEETVVEENSNSTGSNRKDGKVCSGPSCTAGGEGPVASKEYLRCSRCKLTWYCSKACQGAHWKAGHSKVCNSASSAASHPKGEEIPIIKKKTGGDSSLQVR